MDIMPLESSEYYINAPTHPQESPKVTPRSSSKQQNKESIADCIILWVSMRPSLVSQSAVQTSLKKPVVNGQEIRRLIGVHINIYKGMRFILFEKFNAQVNNVGSRRSIELDTSGTRVKSTKGYHVVLQGIELDHIPLKAGDAERHDEAIQLVEDFNLWNISLHHGHEHPMAFAFPTCRCDVEGSVSIPQLRQVDMLGAKRGDPSRWGSVGAVGRGNRDVGGWWVGQDCLHRFKPTRCIAWVRDGCTRTRSPVPFRLRVYGDYPKVGRFRKIGLLNPGPEAVFRVGISHWIDPDDPVPALQVMDAFRDFSKLCCEVTNTKIYAEDAIIIDISFRGFRPKSLIHAKFNAYTLDDDHAECDCQRSKLCLRDPLTTTTTMTSGFLDLPSEILAIILENPNFPDNTLYSLALLCRRLHFIALPIYFSRNGMDYQSKSVVIAMRADGRDMLAALHTALFVSSMEKITCIFPHPSCTSIFPLLYHLQRVKGLVWRFPSVKEVILQLNVRGSICFGQSNLKPEAAGSAIAETQTKDVLAEHVQIINLGGYP
ncbi:hypothetical protein B0H10DRAFT_2187755 [Mycena sp. CBHHK59/15]|nr:hypothetical protein B0H10DRAFT_2187755 [Mycena sp. CBHHK59/15]